MGYKLERNTEEISLEWKYNNMLNYTEINSLEERKTVIEKRREILCKEVLAYSDKPFQRRATG